MNSSRYLFISALLVIFSLIPTLAPEALGATYDATGKWSFTTTGNWVNPGSAGCSADANKTDSHLLIQGANSFDYVDNSDGVLFTGGTITGGATYDASASYSEPGGGTTTVNTSITLSSSTAGSGTSTWSWTDGSTSCNGGANISTTKVSAGGTVGTPPTYDPTGLWHFQRSGTFIDQGNDGSCTSDPDGTNGALIDQLTSTGSAPISIYNNDYGRKYSGWAHGPAYLAYSTYSQRGGVTREVIDVTLSSANSGTGHVYWSWTDGSTHCNGGANITATKPLLALAWMDATAGNAEIYLKRSSNGGNTWTFKRLSYSTGTSSTPSVAVDGQNIYVAWADNTPGNYEIYMKKSTDGGSTWTFRRMSYSPEWPGSPSIAVSGQNVYLAWMDKTSGNYEIYLKKSTDGGNTWTWKRMSYSPGDSWEPTIAVNGQNVYLAWADNTPGNYEIYMKKSTDGGNTWTWKRMSYTPGISSEPSIAVEGSRAYLAWADTTAGNSEIYLKMSRNGGSSWTWKRMSYSSGTSWYPTIAVSGQNLYLAWQDYTPGNFEIYLKRSTNGGSTWTWKRMSYSSGSASYPSVAARGSEAYVAWQDTIIPGGNSEIYLKKSTDAGATWTWRRMSYTPGRSSVPSLR